MPRKTAKNPPSDLSFNLSFLNLIISSYPNFTFLSGKKFKFRPKKTIYYISPEIFEREIPKDSLETFPLLLCHELAHASLGHFSYSTNLERLKIESEAWEETKNLCKKFNLPFSEELAELELNTYRNWLEKKSLCKICGMTRFETKNEGYLCPRCDLLLS